MSAYGRNRVPSSGSFVGWGIVGASTMAARYFLPALRALADPVDRRHPVDVRTVAVYSSNRRRAQAFADQQHIPYAFDDIAPLLDRPDVHCVYIANQLQRHTAAVIAALDSGKHVFCEPLISTDPDETDLLIKRAAIRGLHLWVNHFWRYDPAVQLLRDELNNGHSGEFLALSIGNESMPAQEQLTWRLQPGAGVLWDRTAQDVDLFLYLLNHPPLEVLAAAGQQIVGAHSEVDEELAAILRIRGGALVQIRDAYFSAHATSYVTCHSTYGTWHAEGWADPSVRTILTQRRRAETYLVDLPDRSPHQAILADYMRTVQTSWPADSATASTQHDILAVVRILAALQKARIRGQSVTLKDGNP